MSGNKKTIHVINRWTSEEVLLSLTSYYEREAGGVIVPAELITVRKGRHIITLCMTNPDTAQELRDALDDVVLHLFQNKGE